MAPRPRSRKIDAYKTRTCMERVPTLLMRGMFLFPVTHVMGQVLAPLPRLKSGHFFSRAEFETTESTQLHHGESDEHRAQHPGHRGAAAEVQRAEGRVEQ